MTKREEEVNTSSRKQKRRLTRGRRERKDRSTASLQETALAVRSRTVGDKWTLLTAGGFKLSRIGGSFSVTFRGGSRFKTPRCGGMSWLSPVQWAKWTWSAVTGGAGDDGQPKSQDDEDNK